MKGGLSELIALSLSKGISASSMPRAKSRGFTLVELMAAIVIFSVGILLVIECLERSAAAARSSETYTRAGLLLQEKLAEVQCETPIKTGKEEGKFEEEETVSWESEITETSTTNLFEAKVTIKWQGEEGAKEISAITYLRKEE